MQEPYSETPDRQAHYGPPPQSLAGRPAWAFWVAVNCVLAEEVGFRLPSFGGIYTEHWGFQMMVT